MNPSRPVEEFTADVIVIGSGVSGMTVALSLAPRRVLLVTEADPQMGSATAWALGGIAAALGSDDSPELHARDTVASGRGLVDPELAKLLAEGAPRAIQWLQGLGANFDGAADGTLSLGREGGHSRNRIVHARGDATGAEVARTLVHAVQEADWIRVLQGFRALELLSGRDGSVKGVCFASQQGEWLRVTSQAVVLATGGVGHLFAWTTNPAGAWGSGWYLAAQAGAELADVEFVQFHPTAIWVTGLDPAPLLTEALRGAGALLIDEGGRRYVFAEDPRGELAPRDVVARATWRVRQRGGATFLDARAAVGAAFPERFPTVWAACQRVGIDPRSTPIPCGPAAHYAMGGVAVDSWGRTTVAGLYAVGEVAASGLHGANRLASNSLLEGLVFGQRVAHAISEELGNDSVSSREIKLARTSLGRKSYSADPLSLHSSTVRTLRDRAWEVLGLERDSQAMENFIQELEALWTQVNGSFELEARVFGLAAIAVAALRRTETRGAHIRSDFPEEAPDWTYRQRFAVAWRDREFSFRFAGPRFEPATDPVAVCSRATW